MAPQGCNSNPDWLLPVCKGRCDKRQSFCFVFERLHQPPSALPFDKNCIADHVLLRVNVLNLQVAKLQHSADVYGVFQHGMHILPDVPSRATSKKKLWKGQTAYLRSLAEGCTVMHLLSSISATLNNSAAPMSVLHLTPVL